jgi:hypothetical protein
MNRLVITCAVIWEMLLMASALRAQPEETERIISVIGTGKVSSAPDMATITTGVISEAAEASEALSANNEAVERIMEVLKEFHIAPKDMQTSNFNVSPIYHHDRRGTSQQQITGYHVSNQLRVQVHNLPELGKVLDALVRAGSNQMSGVTFGFDDPEGLLQNARNRAMADARSRAELYAQAAGVRVGEVLQISELEARFPVASPRRMAMDAATEAVPVATGEQEVYATITVVYELARRN